MDLFLPEELIYQILIRVDATSLVRFKIVCKRWRFLLSDSKFVNAHLSYSKPDQIIFSWIHSNMHLRFPHQEVHCYSINMKENIIMRPKEIQIPDEDQLCLRYSCNGLLLLQHRYDKNLVIYNPVTRARTDLPPAPGYCQNYDLTNCDEWALVHDTYSRKYKVFGIKSTEEYFVFTQGRNDWKFVNKIKTPFGRKFTETDFSEVICLENKLHWTATLGKGMCSIYSIDVMDDELMTRTHIPFNVNVFHRLSEVRGSLYITNIIDDGLETWVLKDKDKNLWNKCCRICYGVVHLPVNPYLCSFVIPRDIEDNTRFLDHIRFFLFDDDDRLTVYDVKNKELMKIALKHKKGSIARRHYFHINSLVNWE